MMTSPFFSFNHIPRLLLQHFIAPRSPHYTDANDIVAISGIHRFYRHHCVSGIIGSTRAEAWKSAANDAKYTLAA
jgi:hypothetical protein